MTNYPGICHLVSNSSASLVLYQGDKRSGSFVICAGLLDHARIGHARSAERVRQRGDSLPTKFIFNKTRAKQRRMSESVYLIREQGSGEPRASRSALIEHSRCELCREGLRVGYNEVSQSECERSSFALAKLSSNERRREASAYGARRGYPTRRPSPRS